MSKRVMYFLAFVVIAMFMCIAVFGSAVSQLSFEKIVNKIATVWGEEVVYTYTVHNTSTNNTTFFDVAIMDDNGTPDDPGDDFLVGTIDILKPGDTATFTVSKILTPLCAVDGDGISVEPGSLNVELLANGDVKFTYTQSRDVVDNTYGRNAVGYNGPHFFHHLWRSDNAEFGLTNDDGEVVMHFVVDYLHQSDDFPSGYGSLGVLGGDGSISVGNPGHILHVTTSLADNLNQSPQYYGFTEDSPKEPNYNWDYYSRYTLVISAEAFGESGFGEVSVLNVHNSPSKIGEEDIYPEKCEISVINTAYITATSSSGLIIWQDSDTATVTVILNGETYDVAGTVYWDLNEVGFDFLLNLDGVPIELRDTNGILITTEISTWPRIFHGGVYIGNYIFKKVPAGDYVLSVPESISPRNVAFTIYASLPNEKKVVVDQDISDVDFAYLFVKP